jgi:hypothetical protein
MATHAWDSEEVLFDNFYGHSWKKTKAFAAPAASPVSWRVVSRCHDSGDNFAFLVFEPDGFQPPLNQGLEMPPHYVNWMAWKNFRGKSWLFSRVAGRLGGDALHFAV